MAISRLKWKYPGLGSILRSEEMRVDLEYRAHEIADTANSASGQSYVVQASVGKKRARASVRTGSANAAAKEARSHTLLGSIDAARD